MENGKIECTRQDMFNWNSEYGQREAEANEFASYLLMPRNLFENFIKDKPISLNLLQEVADYFNVSLTAAILKWLQFTDKRAMLVVGIDGFVKWCWSSKKLYKSGVFLQPKKQAIEIPTQSLAMLNNTAIDGKKGVNHKKEVWGFNEEVSEMSIIADSYDMTISLLLFSDDAPSRFAQEEEKSELMDTFDKFKK